MTALHTTYRGWVISYAPPPIPVRSCDWQFVHGDYDGAPDANDDRYGHAPSFEAAKAEIDEREFAAEVSSILSQSPPPTDGLDAIASDLRAAREQGEAA